MKLNCAECKYDYFCCKMRVQVGFWERLRIRLRGYFGCFERDPAGKWVIGFSGDKCCFLDKNNKCKIYTIRPSICRAFPPKKTCNIIFADLDRIKQEHLEILKEVKG